MLQVIGSDHGGCPGFYAYLETRSVFATGVISGIFLILTALTGIWFGSLVDHHPRKLMMQVSAGVSLIEYVVGLVVHQVTPREQFRDPASVPLWILIVLLMVGVIAGNVRTIALPTMVTALIEEDTRDRAWSAIPFMTDGAGARLIGSWFGTGAARGLALVFMLTGIAGLIITAIALRSRPYRRLSKRYTEAPDTVPVTG